MCSDVADFRNLKDVVGYKKDLVFKVQNRIRELVEYYSFSGRSDDGS